MRKAKVTRKTLETSIDLQLNLDGSGQADINTGVGFLDHMLTLVAKHGFMDITLQAQGDLQVDSHHTVEDCGLAFGQALREALGDKAGIHRYGSATIPMDEALITVALDLSNRPFLNFAAQVPKVQLGKLETEMIEEFFRAVAVESGMTLHIVQQFGNNIHHIIEGMFKAFARALAEAVAKDARVKGVMSSKGKL